MLVRFFVKSPIAPAITSTIISTVAVHTVQNNFFNQDSVANKNIKIDKCKSKTLPSFKFSHSTS